MRPPIVSCFRILVCFLALGSTLTSPSSRVQQAAPQDPGVQNPIVCRAGAEAECKIIAFDRPTDCIAPPIAHGESPGQPCKDRDTTHKWEYVSAIRGAGTKIIYSGTVLDARFVNDIPVKPHETPCSNLDWRVVLLSRESSNVLIYGPADISEFCYTDKDENEANKKRIMLVVPVTVIWARIYRYPGNLADPLRKAPSAPPAYDRDAQDYCYPKIAPQPEQQFDNQHNIRPCDRYSARWAYTKISGPIYNGFTQPGTFQGTLSYTPAIGKVPNTTGGPSGEKAPSQTINYDAQLYVSSKIKRGWIGFPVVFEKANAQTANLDSLTMALSYDIPLSLHRPSPQGVPGGERRAGLEGVGPEWFRLWLRPPDFRVQYGLELADSTPHDMNAVGAGSVRVPIVLDCFRQPSAISIFPFFGLEGGNHVVTHIAETEKVFRQVLGYDASARFPFVLAHSLFGDKPETIDFSWRTRYLSYQEPFTDYVSGHPETLSKQQMSYWRGAYSIPFSTYITFKVTVQHGALPPDFHYLGYNVNVGLTFGNPGYSEH